MKVLRRRPLIRMTFQPLQPALMGIDFFSLSGDSLGHRCNHRGDPVKTRVGRLHLLIGQLLRFTQLRDLRVVLQLLVVQARHCSPKLVEAAERCAHCEQFTLFKSRMLHWPTKTVWLMAASYLIATSLFISSE